MTDSTPPVADRLMTEDEWASRMLVVMERIGYCLDRDNPEGTTLVSWMASEILAALAAAQPAVPVSDREKFEKWYGDEYGLSKVDRLELPLLRHEEGYDGASVDMSWHAYQAALAAAQPSDETLLELIRFTHHMDLEWEEADKGYPESSTVLRAFRASQTGG